MVRKVTMINMDTMVRNTVIMVIITIKDTMEIMGNIIKDMMIHINITVTTIKDGKEVMDINMGNMDITTRDI